MVPVTQPTTHANHALGGAAPELYINTPEGEALLTRLIGAMAAGSYL